MVRGVAEGTQQPPSGGCVLKLLHLQLRACYAGAAAFGRLCVETCTARETKDFSTAAAFGRLCVETRTMALPVEAQKQPPSGGCVLKQQIRHIFSIEFSSRLRAAVC